MHPVYLVFLSVGLTKKLAKNRETSQKGCYLQDFPEKLFPRLTFSSSSCRLCDGSLALIWKKYLFQLKLMSAETGMVFFAAVKIQIISQIFSTILGVKITNFNTFY